MIVRNQKVRICLIPLKHNEHSEHDGDEFIDVTLSYRKGGLSYATYKQVPRGFFLSMSAMQIKDGFESFILFGNRSFSAFIEQAGRYSEKRLKELATLIATPGSVLRKEYDLGIEHMQKCGCEIAGEAVSGG